MPATPPTPDEPLAARAREAVRAWTERANSLFNARIPVPELRLDLRGRSAGLAVYSRRPRRAADSIRLNATLLAAHPAEMLEETIPHEVAHIVAHRLHGPRIKPHGAQWQAVMRAFGKSPQVCHAMAAAPSRRMRRYPYRCGCPQAVELTAVRHNRIQRGAAYLCRRCGEQLRPV